MGKRTVGAVGTEMQFMPQPDSTYQERIAEVQGVRGNAPSTSSSAMFAQAADNLHSSWLNFMTSREKRMNEEGLTEANRLIASTTREDRAKLNTIDLAMQYGYGSNVDNPYFIAYSDKLRGQALGDDAKLAYTEMYGDNPAPTTDEEVRRYDEFISKYRDGYTSRGLVSNDIAFEEGFNNRNVENQMDLMKNHVQRDIQDRISEAFNVLKSDLSQFVYDAPSYSHEEQAQRLTEIFAPAKLMALNPEQRQYLADMVTKQYISTGTIKDFEKFKTDILDKVPVQTRMDGTSVMLGDMVDTMALAQMNVEYRKAHVSQLKLDMVKKYGNDKDPTRVTQDIIKKMGSSSRAERMEAEEMQSTLGDVIQAQNANKAERARRAKIAAKGVQTAVKSQASYTAARENLNAFMNGDNVMFDGYRNPVGKPLVGGKNVDAETMLAVIQEKMADINNSDASPDEKGQRLMKLMSYPAADSIKNNLRNSIMQSIDSATEADVNANGVPASIMYLVKARASNKGQFAGLFGNQIDSAISAITNFAGLSGEYDADNALIRGYARYCRIKDMDSAQKQTIMSGINALGNYTIEGLENWGNSSTDSPSVSINNPQIATAFRERALLYGYSAGNAEQGVISAGQDFQSVYAYYHGAVFPKNCFNTGMSPEVETSFAKQALDTLTTYYANRWGVDAGDLSVTYDGDSGSWTFFDASTSQSITMSSADMRNEILYVAGPHDTGSEDTTTYTATPSTSYTPTAVEREVAQSSGSVGDVISEQFNSAKRWLANLFG